MNSSTDSGPPLVAAGDQGTIITDFTSVWDSPTVSFDEIQRSIGQYAAIYDPDDDQGSIWKLKLMKIDADGGRVCVPWGKNKTKWLPHECIIFLHRDMPTVTTGDTNNLQVDVVDKVIARRIIGNVPLYLVAWRGYPYFDQGNYNITWQKKDDFIGDIDRCAYRTIAEINQLAIGQPGVAKVQFRFEGGFEEILVKVSDNNNGDLSFEQGAKIDLPSLGFRYGSFSCTIINPPTNYQQRIYQSPANGNAIYHKQPTSNCTISHCPNYNTLCFDHGTFLRIKNTNDADTERGEKYMGNTAAADNNNNNNNNTTITPHSNDVLSRRGGHSTHPGNIYYCKLVEYYKHSYNNPQTTKEEKSRIASKIVKQIREIGGRFLIEEKIVVEEENGDDDEEEGAVGKSRIDNGGGDYSKGSSDTKKREQGQKYWVDIGDKRAHHKVVMALRWSWSTFNDESSLHEIDESSLHEIDESSLHEIIAEATAVTRDLEGCQTKESLRKWNQSHLINSNRLAEKSADLSIELEATPLFIRDDNNNRVGVCMVKGCQSRCQSGKNHLCWKHFTKLHKDPKDTKEHHKQGGSTWSQCLLANKERLVRVTSGGKYSGPSIEFDEECVFAKKGMFCMVKGCHMVSRYNFVCRYHNKLLDGKEVGKAGRCPDATAVDLAKLHSMQLQLPGSGNDGGLDTNNAYRDKLTQMGVDGESFAAKLSSLLKSSPQSSGQPTLPNDEIFNGNVLPPLLPPPVAQPSVATRMSVAQPSVATRMSVAQPSVATQLYNSQSQSPQETVRSHNSQPASQLTMNNDDDYYAHQQSSDSQETVRFYNSQPVSQLTMDPSIQSQDHDNDGFVGV